jgi:hypothetical protein
MGMNENVDILVCHPDVGINKTLEGVFIQFEVMDPDTQEGTGKSHTVLMTLRPRSASSATSPRNVKSFSRQRCTSQTWCAPDIAFGL